MKISEDFLHYVWKYKLFDKTNLETTNGQKVTIISFGNHNVDAGPDFQNAKLQIDDTTWVGNVEVHTNASEWTKHKHQHDEAYNNVVLHVVYRCDAKVYSADKQEIPTIELEKRIPTYLLEQYENLTQNTSKIACQAQIASVRGITISTMQSRVLVERMERKVNKIYEVLARNNGNWDDTFYQMLSINFGFKVNALPFEQLAISLPQAILAKHKNNSIQIQALLFGQAGLLTHTCEEVYPVLLKKEYEFLQHKYSLVPIESSSWRFLRTRPQNFPTIRIAQLSSLVEQSTHLFSKMVEAKGVKEIKKYFSGIQPHEFWLNHYTFEQKTDKSTSKKIGQAAINNILINTVAPILFAYGQSIGSEEYKQRAFDVLDSVEAEQNSVVDLYKDIGLKIKTAYHSQAILQLKTAYCDTKKCLQCNIGLEILKKNASTN